MSRRASAAASAGADFAPTMVLDEPVVPGVPPARRRLLSMPWWCFPAGLSLGFLLPILLAIAALRGADHPGLMVRGLLFLDAGYVALGCFLLAMIACGGWFGTQFMPKAAARTPTSQALWDGPATALGFIALAAYCIWFRDYVFNPVLLWQTITGEHRPSRDNISLLPGITSLVNVSPAFFAIFAYRLMFAPKGEPMSRPLKIMGFVLIGFVGFRAYAWSERLSTIEMAAPVMLALVVKLAQPRAGQVAAVGGRGASTRTPAARSALVRAVLLFGPYLAIPFVMVLFASFEYFRSWTSATYNGKMDFIDFAVGRFLSYYFTALNNGAGLLATSNGPTYEPKFLLEWAYNIPYVSERIRFADGTVFLDPVDRFLYVYGDPEFNSPTALYAAIVDLGVPLGALYMFVFGAVSGLACQFYRQGRLVGVLLYPTTVVTSMELFRYPYLGQPRAFVAALGMAFVVIAVTLVADAARRRHAKASTA